MNVFNKEQVLDQLSRTKEGRTAHLWGATIGDIDFTGHVFEYPVNFAGARFVGNVNFTSTTFQQQANFDRTTFSEKANFSSCKFQSSAYFRVAEFQNEVGFSNSQFIGRVKFWQTCFQRKANFSEIKVWTKKDSGEDSDGEANFSWVWFFDQVIFTNSQFHGPVYFYRTLFLSDVFLDECLFETKALFAGKWDQVHFRRDALNPGAISLLLSKEIFLREDEAPESFVRYNSFSSVNDLASKLNGLDFAGLSPDEKSLIISVWQKGAREMFPPDVIATFRATRFQKVSTVVEAEFSSVNMNNVFLQSSNIGSVKLIDIQWCRLKFNDWFPGCRRAIRDEIVARNKTEFEQVAEIYSNLKKNYSNNGNYSEAIDFYYGQMEMKRKQANPLQRKVSLLAFYKYLSGYGVRYQLALSWLIIIVCFIFPAIYFLSNSTSGQIVLDQVRNSLLHSLEVITFKSDGQGVPYAVRYVEQIERILVGGIVVLTLDAIRCRIWGIK